MDQPDKTGEGSVLRLFLAPGRLGAPPSLLLRQQGGRWVSCSDALEMWEKVGSSVGGEGCEEVGGMLLCLRG